LRNGGVISVIVPALFGRGASAVDSVQAKSSIVHDNVREALQQFCAHLSHDLNNLLTPLLAYPDMVALELPPGGKALKLLRALESAAERAVSLSRRLGDLSGALRKSKQAFDVGTLVEMVLSELSGLPIAAGVRMDTALDGALDVHMSQDALALAIEEICRNALDALKGSGTLSLRANRQMLSDPFETVSGMAPAGTYAVIEIEDDGIGMSGAMLQRAQEPFCSGFGGGKRCGSGLGLSMAYCALRENGAYLKIRSEDGHGTLVSIYIPETKAQATDADVVKLSDVLEGSKWDGTPQILVVDDEPSIVNLFKLILENYIQGVAVDKASNGAEALAMFSARRYDVIVMDLHMPVMDGQTAFLEIERVCRENRWPMPSVVFCTGYAPRDAVKKAISEGARHTLLNKPVRSEILVKAVQTRLDAASG